MWLDFIIPILLMSQGRYYSHSLILIDNSYENPKVKMTLGHILLETTSNMKNII